MGARASRRRHEGRRIRKNRRAWRSAIRRFDEMQAASRRASLALYRFTEVLTTSLGSIAVAQKPDGSTTIGFDPGTIDPSQTGVEAVRSTHSAAEKVDATSAEMGLRLLPWQRDIAIAALEGRPLALVGGKQCGRSTVLEVVKRARGPEAGEPIIDEIHRMPLG